MRRLSIPLLASLATMGAGPLPAAAPPPLEMSRLVEGKTVRLQVVTAVSRLTGARVTVVQGPSGARLLFRRSEPEAGTVVYEAGVNGRPALTVTRRPGEPVLLEGAGRSLSFYEKDLPRRTVRCWIASLVAEVDAGFLRAAIDADPLRPAAGAEAENGTLYPLLLLWESGPGGQRALPARQSFERGSWSGAPWDELRRLATGEVGR